jgi:hypothetical protein
MMEIIRGVLILIALLCTFPQLSNAELIGSSSPWTTTLNLSPKVKYTQASIFGQGSVPSYIGPSQGVELEYIIGTTSLSIGPYIEYILTSQTNTGSTSSQQETLNGNFTTAGFKLYTNFAFMKIAGSQLKLKDRATGTITNSKDFKSNGLEVGAGLHYPITNFMSGSVGIDISYFKISPSDNPISTRLDYFSYSAVFCLRFEIPSGSPDLGN